MKIVGLVAVLVFLGLTPTHSVAQLADQNLAAHLTEGWQRVRFAATFNGQVVNAEGRLTAAMGRGEMFLCENTVLIHAILHPENGRVFLFERTGTWSIKTRNDGKLEVVLNCPDTANPANTLVFYGDIGLNHEFRSLASVVGWPMIIGNINLVDDNYRLCRRYVDQ